MRNQTKIVINSDGVKALFQHDPEGTVELAQYAASQVAHELANKITKEKIEAKISTMMNSLATDGSNYFNPRLSEQTHKLLDKAVQEKVASKINMTVDSVQYKEMSAMLTQMFAAQEKQFLDGLSVKIDDLIRQRFAAAFAMER